MVRLTRFILAAGSIYASVAACSSNPTSNTGSGGSTSIAGGFSHAGSSVASAGSSVGGMPAAGSASGGASAGEASNTAGAGGSTNAGANTGGSAGSGGGNNGGSGAVVTTCGQQKYTPSATPGAACVTKTVPATPLIAAFEATGPAPGWGVYPNVDGKTGFTPATATPTAGGANGTAQALAFVVTNLAQGIKLQVGFGSQCQDVRTFAGLSFWAKGTIDAATQPFAVDANTLVVQVGSETSILGGCQGNGCAAAPPDKRVTISAEWKEYRIPFDCFGDGEVFDGYYTNILFNALGTNANFAIDQVGYY